MKLSRIAQMYLKVRLKSWLDNDEQHVYMTLTNLTSFALATFYNGRLVKAVKVPDNASGIGTPGTPDGPPAES